jgi:hypothetical protein
MHGIGTTDADQVDWSEVTTLWYGLIVLGDAGTKTAAGP